MKWFGEPWGAPVNEFASRTPTPTAPCAQCARSFDEDDRGFVLPFAGNPGDPPELAYHHECFLLNVGVIKAVHVLRHGRPLCGFSDDPPSCWPEGHRWVRVEDIDLVSCDDCKASFVHYEA